MKRKLLLLAWGLSGWSMASQAQVNVTFNINTGAERATISPYIYGTNQILSGNDQYRSLRMGGNRITGLNWENNASNAGADYIHNSDDYLCGVSGLSATDCGLPGKVYSAFYNQAKSNGISYATTTIPMAGYVAADKNGPVTEAQTAPSNRWKPVVYKKNGAFTTSPSTTDNAVYMDELVNYLKVTHGSAAAGGIKGYFLDNEPALWPSTHPRIHPNKPTAVELWTRSRDLAKAIKNVDATADIYGGVFYGFAEYLNFQDAPDWNTEKGNYSWFVDYFLAKMKAASQADGRRLIDAFDVHWYPEATGDNRIVFSGANTPNDKAARLQAPRSLWDPEYVENSWIGTYFRDRLPILPQLKNSINTYYPGTKLSLSEYFYGGCDEITGGLAEADVLGIFGKYGVYNANVWEACGTSDKSFLSAGIRLYTNYDSNGSAYGNTKVSAQMSDKVTTSVYASIDSTDESKLHVIVINKSSGAVNGTFKINSGATYKAGQVWGFDQNKAPITSRGVINAISGNQFTYTLAPLSAYHLVLTTGTPTYVTRVIVRARSVVNPGATLRIEVLDSARTTGGVVQQSKEFANLPTTFAEYTHFFNGTIPANRIRVRFTNDVLPNRDLEVDYIRVADKTYQTEASTTWATGIWNQANGCNNSGYLRKQLLPCKGYFQYDAGGTSNPEISIYDEALATGWEDWSWTTTNNFANTSPVKVGEHSLSATYTEGWAGLSFRNPTPLATSGYTALRFWVHGGSGANKEINFFTQINESAAPSPSSYFTATAGTWKEVTIPLASLGNPTVIGRITFQNNNPAAQSAIYIDNLQLVDVPAAKVTVAKEAELTSFSLYPNPLTAHSLNLNIHPAADAKAKATLRISDVFGQVVYQEEMAQGAHELAIGKLLKKGLYLVQVQVGTSVQVQKLWVEK